MKSTPSTFWEWLTSLDTDDLAGVSILTVCSVVAVVLIVSITAYYMHKNRLHDSLKREMLDRGFSAKEIALAMHGTPRAVIHETKMADPFRAPQVKV